MQNQPDLGSWRIKKVLDEQVFLTLVSIDCTGGINKEGKANQPQQVSKDGARVTLFHN